MFFVENDDTTRNMNIHKFLFLYCGGPRHYFSNRDPQFLAPALGETVDDFPLCPG